MKSACRWVLPVGFVLALALPVSTQSGPPASAQVQAGSRGPRPSRGPELWWRETSPISKELGLTKAQVDQIEKIFQNTRPDLIKQDQDLRNREDMLSKTILDNAPEWMVSKWIDRVEETRSALNKTRTLMLYRMRQVLNPAQRARFETLHAQFEIELQQAEVERQKQDQKRKQDESQKSIQNPKPDQRPAPDHRGRPGA
jgi:Spy/CpxP family protein refolding chaperone